VGAREDYTLVTTRRKAGGVEGQFQAAQQILYINNAQLPWADTVLW